MKRSVALLLALAALLGASVYAYVRSGGRLRPSAKVTFAEPEKHRVTPAMLAATGAMATTPAPSLRARGTDGVDHDLGELIRSGPLVLVFIKHDCPCSVDAQRFFNRLHIAYGKKVRFLGVIDRDADGGRAWGQQNRTSFPLLADPGLSIVRAYKAESSAYLAVVAKGGTIDCLYPGYSTTMLSEASERIARLAGVEAVPIVSAGAPDELSTGCPFDLGTAD
jgi:peroxiredoxin